jgi:hypothetical protein
MAVTPPKRFQSQSERDFAGLAAKREREAVPAFVEEECTGKYDGDELKEARALRPTDKRLEKLEDKHDKLDEKVDAIHGDVREMRGELKSAISLLSEGHKTQRVRISTNAKILIAIATAAIGAVGTVLVAVLS